MPALENLTSSVDVNYRTSDLSQPTSSIMQEMQEPFSSGLIVTARENTSAVK
jgi:hypothetical protein